MELHFEAMTEGYARAIAGWRYSGPHSMYNSDPAQVEENVANYLDTKMRYHGICSEEGELVGFVCLGEDARVHGGDYSQDALDIGMGVRPDLLSQGIGGHALREVMRFAGERERPVRFRATVAAFNERALRLCESAGFRRQHTFTSPNGTEFVQLTRESI